MNITPSQFLNFPIGSILSKSEYETVARNIMVILFRTGNVFRELSFEEYRAERLKDQNFTESEKIYFDKVSYLSLGNEKEITSFSPEWDIFK